MKYAKLQQIARTMSAEEVTDSLRSLVNDNRFAAVVRMILDLKDNASDTSCEIRFAGSHGALAHAAGERHGLRVLEDQIRLVTDPPKKTGAQPPPPKS